MAKTDRPGGGQISTDQWFMTAALGLAARGLGRTWPNPAVGCILVRPDEQGDQVLSRGWTAPGGRPHAEAQALERAGREAAGATAYVTLEPCAHHGRTPPCATALIDAGVSRVVVAMEDPDPRVAGRGLAMLKAAGIKVTLGPGGDRAADMNAGFIKRVSEGRPLVTWKTATTLDGRIATGRGDSKWITGPRTRDHVHLMRARHDAILTGIGTVLADDPELTCRLPGLEDRSPLRLVADSRLRTPPDARILNRDGGVETWIFTLKTADAGCRRRLEARGATVIAVAPDGDGRPDMAEALCMLATKGVTRVMVESGGGLAASLLRARLIDRIAWFRSPKLFGGDGAAMVGPFGVAGIGDAPTLTRREIIDLGEETLETYAIHY